MFCTHCGTKIESGMTACPHCGEPVHFPAKKSKFPLWLRLLLGLVLIGFVAAFFLFFTETDPAKTVENQLNALGQNQLTEAYYEFTSSEFQHATSLEKFKEYIQANPLLTKIKSYKILEVKEEGDVATLKAALTTDTNENFVVEYILTRDAEGWKIYGLKLILNKPSPEIQTKENSKK